MSQEYNLSILEEARSIIPFLREIPDDIYYQLDHRELHIPNEITNTARKKLELMLDQYVMTYNRKIFLKDIPIQQHLCAHIQGAELNTNKLEILQNFEDTFKAYGVSFVVYSKPISLIDVKDSYIYKQLHKK